MRASRWAPYAAAVTAYPKTLRDIPDADLAERVAERECLEQCSGLERELIARWLAARDMIEWLQAEYQPTARVGGLGRDGDEWGVGLLHRPRCQPNVLAAQVVTQPFTAPRA